MQTYTVDAFAKINLGLHILGKREDGYHSIATVLHRVRISDRITISRIPEQSILFSCSDPGIPDDSTNLCCRAADIFFREGGIRGGVRIHLEKEIPAGAGLGGGSSDAGAVLRVLDGLFGGTFDEEALLSIAARIGSDVPYFLKDGSAKATGRGEILEHFPLLLPYWIVVAYPNIQIDTKWAYRTLSLNNEIKQLDPFRLVADNLTQPRIWVNRLRNDFEPSVFHAYPEIMSVKERLVRGGADFALLSGSGSAVFGLFQNEQFAREIAENLQNTCRTWITEPFFSRSFTLTEENAP